jgi:hypothetical protein
MLRHLPSEFGAADRLPSVAPADGLSIPAVALRVLRVAAAIGPAQPRAAK